MLQNTKGLEAGSLFKFCFIGIILFMMLIACIGTVGGFLSEENWSGPTGKANAEVSINNKQIAKKEVDTSKGIGELFALLTVTPFLAAISAGMVWLMILVGQLTFSLFKPIKLNLTEKGLSFGSSVRLSMIGVFFPWTFLSMIGTLAQVIESGGVESFKVNGDPIGIGLGLTLSLIFIPLLSAMTGALLGLMLYLGQFLFTLVRPLNLIPIPYDKLNSFENNNEGV